MIPYHEYNNTEVSHTCDSHLPNPNSATPEYRAADLRTGLALISREQARSPYLSIADPRKMTETPTPSANLEEASAEASSTPAPPRGTLPFSSSAADWEPSFLSPPPRSPQLASTSSIFSDVPLQFTAGSAVSRTPPSEETSLPLYHTSVAPVANRTNNNPTPSAGARELWRDAKWLIILLVDTVAMIAQVFQAFRSPAAG